MATLDLSGTWKLIRIADGSQRPCALPGDIASALIASGELSDPYRGIAELDAQWIGREDWLLERDFELSPELAGAESLVLELDMIDTLAELRLNGGVIGKSDNMFAPFSADIRAFAKAGPNTLSITIRSPEKAALAAAAELPYPVPASTYPVCSPHRNLIRKAQCMAGWDWGPCLMTGGLYDGLRLIASSGPRIVRAHTSMRNQGDEWLVACSIELDMAKAERVSLVAELASVRAELKVEAPAGLSNHIIELPVAKPELWWPAGHGGQKLYELRLSASDARGGSATLAKRLGFRSLRLINEADEQGRSMAFEINGRRVFLKGANWIPQDALPSRWSKGVERGLIDAALEANMNCLRVWGGGRYESDSFYDYCDATGVLVWQDFMFSCATYPALPEFLKNAEREAESQILRLKDHPCIILWCGNNEDLGAISWFEESRAQPSRYVVDYDRLNEGVLGRLVRRLDPDRPWWPSSPAAGPGDYSDNWHADNAGDMHYWSVWHEGKSFNAYLDVRPRLCSEFGFQSLPSAHSVAAFAEPGQRNVTSPVFEHHQRHPRGNELIMTTMLRYFRMPKGFEETLYLSQVQQAMAIRTAVDYWRSTMPRCMGTLYWQLNDVWPCASWSSLEYGGRWKLLHHDAKRFYESAAPYLFVKDGSLHVGASNDGPGAWKGSIRLRIMDFGGATLMDESKEFELSMPAALETWALPLAGLPALPENCFAVADLQGSGADQPSRAWLFLTEPKRCEPLNPKISYEAEALGDGRFALSLRCEAPAFWLAPALPAPAGSFSDEGFLLLPGETKRIEYRPLKGVAPLSAEAFLAELRCMNLWDSYN